VERLPHLHYISVSSLASTVLLPWLAFFSGIFKLTFGPATVGSQIAALGAVELVPVHYVLFYTLKILGDGVPGVLW
jgi:hypothetical protein